MVRPVENVNGRLIFYSLGNYFMTGAANRDNLSARGNYGLFARVYFESRPDSTRSNGFRSHTCIHMSLPSLISAPGPNLSANKTVDLFI